MVCLLSIAFIIILWFFDVQYYLRIMATVLFGRIFQKKSKLTDPTTIYGFCFTQDLDLVMKHMNNARYIRDLDFARFHYYDRTGLYDEMLKRKTDAVQSATSVRYRRVIPIFTFYKVTTQMIYWDERSIYLEQKFITSDNFVRAAILSKATMHKPIVEEVMTVLNAGPKPQPTDDLKLWLDSMEASSKRLRPDKKD
uniref:Protein THEM6 n=1 Tax=Lygus hesperus TaxID=30085 RepID=A0A0A9W191_LYGHE